MSRQPEPELSLREILRVIVGHRRVIVGLAIVAPILAAILVLTTPRTYTATASFLPENRRGGSALSGLAQQYGLALPGVGSDPGQSLQFYVELVRSREILGRLITDSVPYRTADGAAAVPLAAFLGVNGATPAERLEEGVIRLRSIIRPAASPTTGIIRLQVTTRSPQVSQALAERTLDLINEFNLVRRQSQGASERRFAERRLEEMADSLQAAEARLEEFERRNVQYALSPRLRTEHRRLTNDVAARQSLHTALAQSFEQARMEEVRDTPVITTLERPVVPVRPDSRGGLQKMMFAFFVALAIGIAYAFARSSIAHWKQHYT